MQDLLCKDYKMASTQQNQSLKEKVSQISRAESHLKAAPMSQVVRDIMLLQLKSKKKGCNRQLNKHQLKGVIKPKKKKIVLKK